MSLLLALLLAASPVRAGGDAERAAYEFAIDLCGRGASFSTLALEELARYDRLYPRGRFLDDVHLRMSRVERERGRAGAAAARLLQVLIVDRGSLRETAARRELDALLAAERSLRSAAPRVREALQRHGSGEAEDRREALVRALALADLPGAEPILTAEVELLLERDPASGFAAEAALLAAEQHRRGKEPRRALAAADRVVWIAPGSATLPRALLLAADILERDLDAAIEARRRLERVAREHADSPEAATAWLRLGELERRRFGRAEIAVRDFDEVLSRYPQHPDAFDALLAKAETLARELAQPERAEAVLLEGAETYAEQARAPELLERAARLEEKTLNQPLRAVDNYQRLAGRYPRYAGSPAALFRAGELLEQAGEGERAREVYRSVARRFPGDRLAARAGKRADKLAPASKEDGS